MNEICHAAEKCGIEQGYHDVFGNWHSVSAETLTRLIAALSGGHDANTSFDTAAEGLSGPAFQGDGRRVWGIAVQLYAVRSHRNWGHGDFGDLRQLTALAAARGASAVGLNPLHALFPDRAQQASPYAPNSRLFLNVLYIDVTAIPEFPGVDKAGLREQIKALRASELIEYRAVAHAKMAALRISYERFNMAANAERRADFDAYRAEQGEALLRFACFEVLRAQHAPQPWPAWPEPWCKPGRQDLEAFRAAHLEACGFQEFTQWVADRQLRDCQDAACRVGMSIGLYTDLAVGIDRQGADAWSEQAAVLSDLSVGAPPDAFNPAGQDWGLAPFNPRTLPDNDFAPLRRVMRAVMRRAGAMRIDHVLGLKRMYLIPRGHSASDGAYVRYPFEATLRVIAEESHRARCIVIGEDLGTVPEGFREAMARWGLWTYRVMLFEREHDGSFRRPEAYPAAALATFNTHDLPTFRGWLLGHDLRTKQTIGFDPGETGEARAHSHGALREILSERAVGRAPEELSAVAAVLGATPSRLVMVGLDDILDAVDQINIPGTVDQHPNWRRKLPADIEDLEAHPLLISVAEAFAQAGRASP